jgi:predicted nucleotide-binding protein (sugar kinase/HSP70/actin superfamily)
VVSVDYDPGASEVNQLNRIKLMVATAHKHHATREVSPGDSAAVGSPARAAVGRARTRSAK